MDNKTPSVLASWRWKNKKLTASTIQETMVAMTVVLICFSIGLMIFVNIMKTEKATDKLRATIILKEVAADAIQNKRFINEEFERKQFIINKTIKEHPTIKGLLIMNIQIIKNNQLMANSQQLITIYKPNINHDY
jgi:hypothetical protein